MVNDPTMPELGRRVWTVSGETVEETFIAEISATEFVAANKQKPIFFAYVVACRHAQTDVGTQLAKAREQVFRLEGVAESLAERIKNAPPVVMMDAQEPLPVLAHKIGDRVFFAVDSTNRHRLQHTEHTPHILVVGSCISRLTSFAGTVQYSVNGVLYAGTIPPCWHLHITEAEAIADAVMRFSAVMSGATIAPEQVPVVVDTPRADTSGNKGQQEPDMSEILGSIRRIISEDEGVLSKPEAVSSHPTRVLEQDEIDRILGFDSSGDRKETNAVPATEFIGLPGGG